MPRTPVVDESANRLEHQVVGNKADTAVQAAAATKSIVAYLKGILDALMGSDGLVVWPAAAAPADGVSLAEVLRYIADAQAGAAGLPAFPAAAAAANDVSLAEVLRYIQEKKLDAVETVAGEADIDISEALYTGYITLLTIAPASGEALLDCWLHLDWNKTTTGAHAIGMAADTLDAIVMMKVDDTNLRHAQAFTQVTISDTPTDEASGQRLHIGPIGPTETCVVKVKVSAERDDVEIPYRIMYRGAAPTITPVAAA